MLSKTEGVGVGLRFPHFNDILNSQPKSNWVEVMTDDFLSAGPHHDKLLALREQIPMAFHSVGLNIGGTDPFNGDYLKTFKDLYDKYEPFLISDHLCWSTHQGRYHHDLLPIPKTKEALVHVCRRIDELQNYFQRPLTVENITTYIDFKEEDFSEIDFIKTLQKTTGCFLLLDITNVRINHTNRKEDSSHYFDNFPLEEVRQVHLAGGQWDGDTLIDSHSHPVSTEDLDTLKELYHSGRLKAPALIERDASLPSFKELEAERQNVEEVLL